MTQFHQEWIDTDSAAGAWSAGLFIEWRFNGFSCTIRKSSFISELSPSNQSSEAGSNTWTASLWHSQSPANPFWVLLIISDNQMFTQSKSFQSEGFYSLKPSIARNVSKSNSLISERSDGVWINANISIDIIITNAFILSDFHWFIFQFIVFSCKFQQLSCDFPLSWCHGM